METIYSSFIGLIGVILGATLSQYISSKTLRSISLKRQQIDLALGNIEKRMVVHQEAYRLWYELFDINSWKPVRENADSFFVWWLSNCLYLDQKVRYQIYKCIRFAQKFDSYNDEEIQKVLKHLYATGPVIEKAVHIQSQPFETYHILNMEKEIVDKHITPLDRI